MVAAAGNQGTVGSSAITRHPWVIPVVACDLRAGPLRSRILAAPSAGGDWPRRDKTLSASGLGQAENLIGTSAAAPFVTGAIALLWSEFPGASAAQIELAVTQAGKPPRRTSLRPCSDAWAAYEAMSRN